MTNGEKVIAFIETFCVIPEGMLVGKPMILSDFQKRFILDVYDNPHKTSLAILSLARKNGKSALVAALLLAHIIGPMAVPNSQIISGAMSRDQAALIFSLAYKMLCAQPMFAGRFSVVPSAKRILGVSQNVEYRAISAEATTAHGLSPALAILDEVGQIRGPTSPFIEAITTSQGAHANPLLIVISTQAPTDADMLSLWIDDALRSGNPHVVCHLHAADKDCDLDDRSQWAKANPGLGTFRSEQDLERQISKAKSIPSLSASVRNLLLNQRIAQESLWLAPEPWKACGMPPILDVFRESPRVSLGMDLSQRHDLTAMVLAALDDDGTVHIMPFVFCPMSGLLERETRDKAPYSQWAEAGHLVLVPGATLSYEWIFEWIKLRLDELRIAPTTVQFDRWRIIEAKAAAERVGALVGAEWVEVGQGYKDMAPRIEAFETYLLQGRMRHGSHPLLNMAAAGALATKDPAGNRKLDKAKTTARIDPLVAAVMAVGAFSGTQRHFDVSAMIG